MSNIYDTANQLERDWRELQEFKTVKKSFEAMYADKNNSQDKKSLKKIFKKHKN